MMKLKWYLRIIINYNLELREHANFTFKKVTRTMGVLRKLANAVSTQNQKMYIVLYFVFSAKRKI